MNEETVREIVGGELSDTEAKALLASYAALARAVATFPQTELKDVEPPLRSVAGPLAR